MELNLKLKDSAVDLPALVKKDLKSTDPDLRVNKFFPIETKDEEPHQNNYVLMVLSAQLIMVNTLKNWFHLNWTRVSVFALLTFPIQIINLSVYIWLTTWFSLGYVVVLGRKRFFGDCDAAVEALTGRSITKRAADVEKWFKKEWEMQEKEARVLATDVYTEGIFLYSERLSFYAAGRDAIHSVLFDYSISKKIGLIANIYLKALGVMYGLACFSLVFIWSLLPLNVDRLYSIATRLAQDFFFGCGVAFFLGEKIVAEYKSQSLTVPNLIWRFIVELLKESVKLVSVRSKMSLKQPMANEKQSSFIYISDKSLKQKTL